MFLDWPLRGRPKQTSAGFSNFLPKHRSKFIIGFAGAACKRDLLIVPLALLRYHSGRCLRLASCLEFCW